MFEEVDELAARLLATAPAQDDPFDPILDPDATLVDRLVTLARVIAAAQAETMIIEAALCERAETWQNVLAPDTKQEVGPADLVAAEIGPALHLAQGTAASHVARAVEIVTRLPLTLAAMRRGDLDLGRVLAIVDATQPLSDADASKVEQVVLGRAVEQTAGELRAALRKAVIRIDPTAAERRRKEAVKGRRVIRYQRDDGMSALEAILSAVDSGEIYDVVDEMARQMKTDGDTRSMDQRRADALVMIITGREPHLGPQDSPPPPDEPGDDPGQASDPDCPDDQPDFPGDQPSFPGDQPDFPGDQPNFPSDFPADPTDPADLATDEGEADWGWPDAAEQARRTADLNRFDHEAATRTARITELAALALSGMTRRRAPRLPWVAINETAGADGTVTLVGELQGYGPITADYAFHLLSAGAARAPDRPSGRTPTPAQAAAHDPPDWLAADVKARDGTCRYPGCKQPAHRVDLDHTIAHAQGGPTVRENLGGLCRRHHRVKHSGCWSVRQHSDGIYEWVSKITGRSYTTYPRGHTGEWRGATTRRS